MSMLVEVSNLSHSYGEKMVLNDISLNVEKGKVMGLLGPSGAGKTTLVNILTGQITPTAGNIKLFHGGRDSSGDGDANAVDVTEIGADQKMIAGIMMDSFGLYDRLSVWDNLKIFADLYQVPKEKIDELLQRTELSHARKTLVSDLSKGMRNRVNLCRALLKEADILYLDEPTSGLDPATTEKIHELIIEEKNRGTTVFLTTHNMHEATKLCDNIILLHEGKIVERGVPGEICLKYNLENKIEIILKNGEIHTLKNASESAPAIEKWMENEQIMSIHSSEPDLEKVFLHLTGKELNK